MRVLTFINKPNSLSAEKGINLLFRWYHWLFVFASVAKCVKLFILRLRENSMNFNLYALTTEYISWSKVPFPISFVPSSFICLNKFTMNKIWEPSLIGKVVKPLYFSFILKSCRTCSFRSRTHFKTFPKTY